MAGAASRLIGCSPHWYIRDIPSGKITMTICLTAASFAPVPDRLISGQITPGQLGNGIRPQVSRIEHLDRGNVTLGTIESIRYGTCLHMAGMSAYSQLAGQKLTLQ